MTQVNHDYNKEKKRSRFCGLRKAGNTKRQRMKVLLLVKNPLIELKGVTSRY